MTPRSRKPVETQHLELSGGKRVRPQRFAFSRFGMVSTAHYAATEAGVEMLAQGGNAVDAAVAAAFALGVCEPQASGLGGQTMMLLHLSDPRRLVALDGSSRAPNRATPESLTSAEMRMGYRATTVPSTPAVLGYTLRTYGKLPLQRVLGPAIRLAEEGFTTTDLYEALSRRELQNLIAGNAAELFLKNGKRPLRPGSVLRQPSLGNTLRRLAGAGIEDFYTGQIAARIAEDMKQHDGLLHRDDLAQIPWPIERRPVASRFKGMRVVSFPPPGGGRVLLGMLNILEDFPERLWTPDTPRGAHLLVEIIRSGALDRQDRPYDPDLYPQFGNLRVLDRDSARRVARRLRKRMRAFDRLQHEEPAGEGSGGPPSRGETTHLSVMDRSGNAVALTQSIERVFGSFVATPDLGFLYNNYMSAYEYTNPSHPYYMRPNAPPWASVAPTIIFRGRRPWVALGSPGSERIVSALLQVILRLLRNPPYDAVSLPRLHCSIDGKVSLEASRFRDDIPRLLEGLGFEIDVRDTFSFYLGCVQLVLRDRYGFVGVADPRRDGAAAGPAA